MNERSRNIVVSAAPSVGGKRLYTNSWAVVIGIDAYPEGVAGIPPLECAESDARDLPPKTDPC